MTDSEVDRILLPAIAAHDAAEFRYDLEIRRLRQNGATWTQLGSCLGVSPQAVQQRYGGALTAPEVELALKRDRMLHSAPRAGRGSGVAQPSNADENSGERHDGGNEGQEDLFHADPSAPPAPAVRTPAAD